MSTEIGPTPESVRTRTLRACRAAQTFTHASSTMSSDHGADDVFTVSKEAAHSTRDPSPEGR
jgi:hypothetical protein